VEIKKPQGRVGWTGEVKKREQQGEEKKNGTLEIWKRDRKSSVKNTGELTVDLQSPGEEREKNGFVAKEQVRRRRVGGGVEICGIFLTPRFSSLSAAVVLGVLVNANCIFMRI